MIELKKMHTMSMKNLYNFSIHQIIQMLSGLHSTYLIHKNQGKFVIHMNNYIDRNKFNQLHNFNKIEKDLKNAKAVFVKCNNKVT